MDISLKPLGENLFKLALLMLLVPVSAISVIAVVWPSEHEVLWHGAWVFRSCGVPGKNGAPCIGRYELSFGNTGEHAEDVLLDWPADLRRWSMNQRVLNISAGRERSNDPEFTCTKTAARANCSISDFAAGALLIIELRCVPCTETDLTAIEANPPRVASKARVYESDPRATLLFRRLGVLLSWL